MPAVDLLGQHGFSRGARRPGAPACPAHRRGTGRARTPSAATQDGHERRGRDDRAPATVRLPRGVGIARLQAARVWYRGRPLLQHEMSMRLSCFSGKNHAGALLQLFNGHLARVAGAAWLVSRGVPTPIIQLLRRWQWPRVLQEDLSGPPAALCGAPAGAVDFVRGTGPGPSRRLWATHHIYNANWP